MRLKFNVWRETLKLISYSVKKNSLFNDWIETRFEKKKKEEENSVLLFVAIYVETIIVT